MGATAREIARFVTPGSTTTRESSSSTDRIRRIRASTIRTPSAIGSAPPESPVPAPRATQGTPASKHGGHNVPDLVRGAGQNGGERRLAVVRQPVGAVGGERVRVREHVLGSADPLQCGRRAPRRTPWLKYPRCISECETLDLLRSDARPQLVEACDQPAGEWIVAPFG